jgi:membrane protein DedA with SNARE-associated domain
MPMGKFIVYTFVGSYPWCYALAWAGAKLGQAWHTDPRLKALYHRFELAIVVAGVAAVAWFVWHKVREARRYRVERQASPGAAADEA